MAGGEPQGFTWAELEALGTGILGLTAIGSAVGALFLTKFRTEENTRQIHEEREDRTSQIDELRTMVQQLSDAKAGRDEMRAAVQDLKETIAKSVDTMERKVDASDSRVERTVTSMATSLTSQITTLTSRIDAMMQRSRTHA